jgi:hypothetical protein
VSEFENVGDCGTDEELNAEVRMIGLILKSPEVFFTTLNWVPCPVYCAPFHGAIALEVGSLAAARLPVTPQAVWERVKSHPDAWVYEEDGLEGFIAHADPKMVYADMALLTMRVSNIVKSIVTTSQGDTVH